MISWWLPAAFIALTAPLWLRALVRRWQRPASLRTDAGLRRLEQMQRDEPRAGEHDPAQEALEALQDD
jgi:hypothetical protein